MATTLTAKTVYGGPGSSSTYASIGSLSAGESYDLIWHECGYKYIEYDVSAGRKRGYISGGNQSIPDGYDEGMLGRMKSDQSVWSKPGPNRVSLGSVSQNEYVTVLFRSIQYASYLYAFVEYGSNSGTKRGWVLDNAIELYSDTALAKMTSSATVFSNVSLSNSIGSLGSEEFIVVIEETDSYAKVEYCTKTSPFRKQGYISRTEYERINTAAVVPGIPVHEADVGILASLASATNVYGGPSSENYAVIGSVAVDESIRVIHNEWNWFYISYSTNTGVKRGYVPQEKIYNYATISANVVNKSGDYTGSLDTVRETSSVYTGPGADFVAAGSIAANEPITRFDYQENGFTLIEYQTMNKTKRGYIVSTLLNSLDEGVVGYVTPANGLAVYYDPTFRQEIGSVNYHEYVIVLGESSNRLFIEYNATSGRKRGYVYNSAVQLPSNAVISLLPTEEWTIKKATAELIVRSGPSSKYASIGTVFSNEPVSELYTVDDWSYIQYTTATAFKRGYVQTSNLENANFFINDFSHLVPKYPYGSCVNYKSGQGRDLYYYKIGSGTNHLLLNFAIHGWEDIWDRSGEDIERVGEATLEYLANNEAVVDNNNWTVYLILTSNPDGLLAGNTHNGPGRCSVLRYSNDGVTLENGGVDINRSFSYKDSNGNEGFLPNYSSRNYTGAYANGCPESRALKEFIDSNKSLAGKNIFIDVHGYTNQILVSANDDDDELYVAFNSQFGYGTPSAFGGNNGRGYAARYAHDFQNMHACLFEFPSSLKTAGQLFTQNYHTKFINAIMTLITTYPQI